MTNDVRILDPGQAEAPLGEIPFLALPGRDTFAVRAARLRSLAPGNALEEYLAFLAALAEAQQSALDRLPPAIPDTPAISRRREAGLPLLDARSHERDSVWRDGLSLILERMADADLPPAAHEAVSGLMHSDEARLERTAELILAGDFGLIAPRELPFVAAGLQVHWVRMAASLNAGTVGRLHGGRCPVCGSHPMIGIVQATGRKQGLRYLSCSLCSSEWHLVRIKCSACESTEGLEYYSLDGANGAVKAESCGSCRTYVKLLYRAKDTRMDPLADDLATLTLDMLMEEAGWQRGGPNLFFHPGAPH